MAIHLFLTYTSFILYLLMGIHIFVLNHKENINKIFISTCFFFAMWAFAIVALYLPSGNFSVKLLYFGFLPGHCLLIHFSIVFSAIRKARRWILLMVYGLGTYFLIVNSIFQPIYYADTIIKDGQLLFQHAGYSASVIFFTVYVVSSSLICFVLIMIRRKRTDSERIKKQAGVIGATMLISIILGFIDEVLLPLVVRSYYSHAATIIFFLLWIGGIWYSILKYRFMSINPEAVSNEILLNIDEFVILIDNEMNIIKVNSKVIDTLLIKNDKGISLENIFYDSERIREESKNILISKGKNFSCRINLIDITESKILIDAKFSAIKDRFGDIIGIIVIGREVKEMKQLKNHYHITDREADILQCIVKGNINKEIADNLGISERTVKMHISNILSKLEVNNKTQLIAFLKNFNLIPEYHSDQIIII